VKRGIAQERERQLSGPKREEKSNDKKAMAESGRE